MYQFKKIDKKIININFTIMFYIYCRKIYKVSVLVYVLKYKLNTEMIHNQKCIFMIRDIKFSTVIKPEISSEVSLQSEIF